MHEDNEEFLVGFGNSDLTLILWHMLLQCNGVKFAMEMAKACLTDHSLAFGNIDIVIEWLNAAC